MKPLRLAAGLVVGVPLAATLAWIGLVDALHRHRCRALIPRRTP